MMAATRIEILVIALLVSVASAWTITHPDTGEQISGEGERPHSIAAYQTAASSIWDFGIRPDNGLIGFWGSGRYNNSLTWHETQIGDVDTTRVEDFSLPDTFDLNTSRIAEAKPDLLLSATYVGWDFSVNETELESKWQDMHGTSPPYVQVEVKNRTALDIAETFLQILQRTGHGYSDLVQHQCRAMQFAMNDTRDAASSARERGISILSGAFGTSEGSASIASPTEDPFLSMLEVLGMPMIHPDVDRFMSEFTPIEEDVPYFWESNSLSNISDKYASSADVVLFDNRDATIESEYTHTIAETAPSFENAQVVPWPLEGAFSFSRITEFLHKVSAIVRHATKVNEDTPCEDNSNARAMLTPGRIRCEGSLSPPRDALRDGYCPSSSESDQSWRITDSRGALVSGSSKPTSVLAHAQIAEAMQDMGMSCDQIAGVFSEHGRTGLVSAPMRSGTLDKSRECLYSFGSTGIETVLQSDNASKLNDLGVDLILTFADITPQDVADAIGRWVPVVKLSAETVSSIASANRMRSIVQQIALQPEKLGEEESAYCNVLQDDAMLLRDASDRAHNNGVRVVAINPWDEETVYIGNPVVHPHLRTLEMLGVPLVHPTDESSKKWVPVSFEDIDANPDAALLNASVALFTTRGVNFTTQVNSTSLAETTAYSTNQISPWHISFTSSFKSVKRAIEDIIPVVRSAQPLDRADILSSCIESDNFNEALGEGEIRCYTPQSFQCLNGVGVMSSSGELEQQMNTMFEQVQTEEETISNLRTSLSSKASSSALGSVEASVSSVQNNKVDSSEFERLKRRVAEMENNTQGNSSDAESSSNAASIRTGIVAAITGFIVVLQLAR